MDTKRNNFKIIQILILFLIFGISNLLAQEAVISAGGNTSSSAGTINYTIGQISYSSTTGSNGNFIVEGIQQPYEISVILGSPDFEDINFLLSAYPNPTSNFLNLDIDNIADRTLHYELYSLLGKLIKKDVIKVHKTQIEVKNLQAATYFLKIYSANKEIKTFKIIKH